MPYDDLFGSETGTEETAPALTFNVAAAPLPPPPPRPGKVTPDTPDLPIEGIVVGDDRPVYVPPRAADEPPEPLLRSPVPPAPPAAAALPSAPPAPAVTNSELFD